MRIRAALVAVVLACTTLLLTSVASAQTAEVDILQVDATRHPDVRMIVAVPGADPSAVDAGRLQVTENGEPVDIAVKPLASRGMQVALVLDVSLSMEGAPLDAAKASAAAFVSSLPAGTSIAIVAFGGEARLVTPFTSDHSLLNDGIASLEADGGTALFDGVSTALDALGPARGGQQAIVTLSDGGDTESKVTLEEAAGRIAESGVQFTGIGFETSKGSLDEVTALAESAGGSTFLASDPSSLARVYDQLAASFGSLVDVRYTTAEKAGEIEIAVTLDAGDAATRTVDYGSVTRAVPTIDPDAEVVASGGLLTADWVPWMAALLIASGIVGCILLAQNDSRRKELEDVLTTFNDDSGEFSVPTTFDVGAPDGAADSGSPGAMLSGIAGGLTEAAAKVLEKDGRADRMDQAIERAGLAMKAGELGAFVLTGSLAGLALGYLLGGTGMAIALFVAPWVLTKPVLNFLAGRRRKKFGDQLGDTLMLISGALKAGYGLAQAIDSVAAETPAPTSEEFSRVLLETRLGLSMEDALDGVGERMECEDFDWVINAVKINATVGGDLSGILDQVGDTIRARNKIRRQIAALAAEGKISALVLFCLPPALVFFITTSNPDYIAPMFESTTGNLMLGFAGLLMLMGGAWLKKIVNPEI